MMNPRSICISREELDLSIQAFFKISPLVPYNMTAVWSLYRGMLRHSFQMVSQQQARSSGKTMTMAIVGALAIKHFNLDVMYVSDFQAQLRHFERYMEMFGVPENSYTAMAYSLFKTAPGASVLLGDEISLSTMDEVVQYKKGGSIAVLNLWTPKGPQPVDHSNP